MKYPFFQNDKKNLHGKVADYLSDNNPGKILNCDEICSFVLVLKISLILSVTAKPGF